MRHSALMPAARAQNPGNSCSCPVSWLLTHLVGATSMGAGYAERFRPTEVSIAWTPRTDSCAQASVRAERPYHSASDAELLSWSAGGDREAFDEVVNRHSPYALRVALRLIPDPAAAEEIVQEAMVRTWSQARQFDPGRARFTTWLYRIVVNLCIDQRRRPQHEPIPEDFEVADPAPGVEEIIGLNERQAALKQGLRDLPVRQRAALTLVYDQGLSGAEAGQALGLSAKAVERLLSRARAFLRERLRAGHV